jgi:DNA-binding CsgD family transcriptional regulator
MLSPQQQKCLQDLANGYTTKQVAIRLGISIRTVEKHLSAAKHKLKAVSLYQAIKLALKKRFIN